MPQYRSVDFRCTSDACLHSFSELIERELVSDDLHCACPECGTDSIRAIGTPMVLKASWPDGFKRGDSYEALKRASKLKVERASLPESQRGDINKEIKEAQKVASKKSDKSIVE